MLPRTPRQARSRRTRDRILEAAEAIVAGEGFEAAGIAAIAQRAGCSVGAFYARFRDKRELLEALHERFAAEASARLEAGLDPRRWAEQPLPRCLHGLLGALVRLHRERRGLARAFAVEAQRDPAFQARRDALLQDLVRRLAALVGARARELGHHHPERALAFGLAVCWSTLEGALLFDRLRAVALAPTDDDLAAELVRVLAGYLRLRDE